MDYIGSMKIETYPEEASHNCRKWTWAVFDDEGENELARGFVEGSLSQAEQAAHAAKNELYMQRKAPK